MKSDPNKCSFCEGNLRQGYVDVIRRRDGRIYLFEHVPAKVCDKCGEQYYADEVLARMDDIIKSGQGAEPVEATKFVFPKEKEAA